MKAKKKVCCPVRNMISCVRWDTTEIETEWNVLAIRRTQDSKKDTSSSVTRRLSTDESWRKSVEVKVSKRSRSKWIFWTTSSYSSRFTYHLRYPRVDDREWRIKLTRLQRKRQKWVFVFRNGKNVHCRIWNGTLSKRKSRNKKEADEFSERDLSYSSRHISHLRYPRVDDRGWRIKLTRLRIKKILLWCTSQITHDDISIRYN